ncbi:hypothetical protein LEP1GSC043_3378 [Leptospira weilii str. Ecochallenge]|uniref:Uncharacterized protein n=1 Tax=Leptospira weilii str. Ecochallenge TaxID=1049986 RepID=N1U4Z1_9LEPT|nr:hypothetical protein LEP1GSC043_3378 [Leptospira weilii str. Ecochallenge]
MGKSQTERFESQVQILKSPSPTFRSNSGQKTRKKFFIDSFSDRNRSNLFFSPFQNLQNSNPFPNTTPPETRPQEIIPEEPPREQPEPKFEI